ncbi:PAQR family membrane homeostasis protein TrhA [Bifidobacterium simiarum]|uniref:PAQR family membrane homeostasis protein TrhA n=1 Tax=Bifidobacterium simiarum TaxID=2045441 RepID=UPI001BDCEEBF|nr:hemolysin III family protein [Bifidobacterium simiarum]MBT1166681.1 hemolysin III family protein [Bifidobacterium simiarum]
MAHDDESLIGVDPSTLGPEDRARQLDQARAAVRRAFLEDQQAKAREIRARAKARADRIIARGELRARRVEDRAIGIRKVRLDVHGRPKPLMRGWIHAVATPLALAAGIVLICISPTVPLKWACAVFMTCSLILFGNSAAYHLGDWSPKVTDVLRRIDHVNIFLLIAGTYTPVSFALNPFWRDFILTSIWVCTTIALIIHVVWINAPRWLYTIVYIIFGVSGVAYLGLFWTSPYAGPVVVILLGAGGACYIAGAIVYALRRPDPWPKVFGFHEIFHCGTVAGYACHMVAIYFVAVALMQTV